MKRLSILPLALLLGALCVNPARADEDASLANELANMREAWLFGDAETAAARLDVLRADDRLSGDMPRWYALMRATLAMREGDGETAWSAVEPRLADARDARDYIRAARVFLTYAHPQLAEKAIDAGLERRDDSPGLLRFKAGLQWLGGDHDAALETYMNLLLKDERPNYPYVPGYNRRWSELPAWETPEADEKDSETDDEKEAKDKRAPGETDREGAPDGLISEPHISLFMPVMWYVNDLPGLDRCVLAMSTDETLVRPRRERHAGLIEAARNDQGALDNYRGGDTETRTGLEQSARASAWRALLNARIVAQAHLSNGEYEKAETIARDGLRVAYDDVALLDIVVQCQGKLGKAEEARTGAIASLSLVVGLDLSSSLLMGGGPGAQELDRILEPALILYKANPEAGQRQFEELRKQFSQGRRTLVFPGAFGMWLYLRGEYELARRYLLESSRFSGHDSGRSLSNEALFVELGLLAIGEGDLSGDEQDDQGDEGEAAPAPGPEGEEVDPVEMAEVGDAHPLLRKSLRAGGVMGATYSTVHMLRRLAEVDLWGGRSGIDALAMAATALPEGDRLVSDILFGLPAEIVEKVDPDELRAFIDPGHNATTALKGGLESLADTCEQFRTTGNWRLRQSIQATAEPVFGMVEARAILLRAQLRHDGPRNFDELSAWLARYQEQIDLRRALQTSPDDRYVRAEEARREAGVPEVVHRGLLLDAAVELARAGRPGDAAKLIWLNRETHIGMETPEHLLWLASVFARKAGDALLSAHCLIEGASRAQELFSYTNRDVARNLFELRFTRDNLLEFGSTGDVLSYFENVLASQTTGTDLAQIVRKIPELKDAPTTMLLSAPSAWRIERVFAMSIENANCSVVQGNWAILLRAVEDRRSCHRLAAWVFASDLPLNYRHGGFSGCTVAEDVVEAWKMLQELYEQEGNEPEATRIAKLITQTAGS